MAKTTTDFCTVVESNSEQLKEDDKLIVYPTTPKEILPSIGLIILGVAMGVYYFNLFSSDSSDSTLYALFFQLFIICVGVVGLVMRLSRKGKIRVSLNAQSKDNENIRTMQLSELHIKSLGEPADKKFTMDIGTSQIAVLSNNDNVNQLLLSYVG